MATQPAKRVKREGIVSSQAATTSSTTAPKKSKDEQLEEGPFEEEEELEVEVEEEQFEEVEVEVEEEKQEEDEELPPYHEYHCRRNFKQKAIYLMRYHGLDLWKYDRPDDLLEAFCRRYYPQLGNDRSTMWSWSFEEYQWYEKWGRWKSWKTSYRATVTIHVLDERKFRHVFTGSWSGTERLAKISAMEVFRSDWQIQKIAERLPPPTGNIRENTQLKTHEKDALKADGINTSEVQQELINAVYIHFRDLGCRTALWDDYA